MSAATSATAAATSSYAAASTQMPAVASGTQPQATQQPQAAVLAPVHRKWHHIPRPPRPQGTPAAPPLMSLRPNNKRKNETDNEWQADKVAMHIDLSKEMSAQDKEADAFFKTHGSFAEFVAKYKDNANAKK